MEISIIAIIIMAVTLVFFVWEKFPLAGVAVLSMLAMGAFGCASWGEVFSGFSNTATIMMIGTSIIGGACFSTGLAEKISRYILKFKKLNEASFILIIVIAGTFLSAPLSGMAVMVMLMPIINAVAAETNGKICRKNVYLPLGIASVFGGNLTCIGSTSMLNASAMLGSSYYGREMSFFEPATLGFIGALVGIVIPLISKGRFERKIFDFEEPPIRTSNFASEEEQNNQPIWKMIVVALVFLGTTIGYIIGLNYSAVALFGACIVIFAGCIDMKKAVDAVNWNTILVVAGTIGFAKGIEVSGAGEIIAESMIGFFGPLAESPFGMCAVLMLISTVLSNFTSNNATVGICVPIALAVARTLGADPVIFVICCGIGANLSVATPMCTAPITVTTSAGYRFKDFARYGGLQNVIAYIFTVIGLKLFYFM